jgi:P4 family phage/plasmid primase-like protien
MSKDKKINYESEVKARLKPNHIDDLQKSGLSFETIYNAGYKSDMWADKYSCWSIKFDNPLTGNTWFHRVRLDEPFNNKKDGSTAKYLQPRSSGCQLYMSKQLSNNQWHKLLPDISIERFLIEGEKKCDCAIQYSEQGQIHLGLTGVYGWSKNNHLIDFLDQYVALPKSKITICVDSDYKTNPKIQKAIHELALKLLDKDITVSLIVIPGNPDKPDEKVGLDDYLIRFTEDERRNEFRKLISTKIRLTKQKLKTMQKETRDQLKPAKQEKQQLIQRADTPNFIGMVNSMLGKYYIEADKFGSVYMYNDQRKYFEELTKSEVLQHALHEDCLLASNINRRKEVHSLLIAKCLNPKLHQLWRNISPYQIPVQNGIIDLKENKLLEHKIENYLESVIEADYIPGAKNQALEEFLLTTFEDDLTKIDTLQEFAGYSLMPCASAKKALFAIGESNTGKSVFGHLLTNLHGYSNISSISIKQMADPIALHELIGKSLNLVPEIEVGEAIPDAIFKTLVGTEELISIRKLYIGFIKYKPYAKHIFLCNNMPIIKDPSKGTINRILPLEFINVVPEFKRDLDLPKKILADKAGFLNWCVQGALRLVANNFQFTIPKSSEEILNCYRKNNNQNFSWFIGQYFDQDSGSKVYYEDAWSLFEEVRNNLDKSSELHHIRSKKKFSDYLKHFGFSMDRVPDPNNRGGKKQIILGLKKRLQA